ncbi:MAG TPA: glycosyltransferase family 2 protein [Gammaproteobacteria bacterium]
MQATYGNRVGVVIPTRGRARLVLRAVKSVLAQTHTDLEVIVVLDGPDDETVSTLSAIDDPRLRVEVMPQRGASAARNRGVQLANTDWVAFLDDDDLWRPGKLEMQLMLAKSSTDALPIVSCRSLNVSHQTASPYPLRIPLPNEPVSEFLFSMRGWPPRHGGIQTPTILAPRILFKRLLFDETLPRHEDWDWLLRAVQIPGSALLFLPEILVEVDRFSSLQRLSSLRDWRYSFNWIRARYDLVTKRAYSGFLLTVIPAFAARGGAGFGEFLLLLKEAAMRGQPNLIQLTVFAIWWLLPLRLVNWTGKMLVKAKSG